MKFVLLQNREQANSVIEFKAIPMGNAIRYVRLNKISHENYLFNFSLFKVNLSPTVEKFPRRCTDNLEKCMVNSWCPIKLFQTNLQKSKSFVFNVKIHVFAGIFVPPLNCRSLLTSYHERNNV